MIRIRTHFESRVAQVRDEVHRRIVLQMLELGQRIVAIARTYAPAQTGALRRSIGFDWNEGRLTLVLVVGVDYGLYVEYGTRSMAPRPYLRPAINTVAPIFGYATEMAFAAGAPVKGGAIRAVGQGFRQPKSLTPRQRAHVARELLPASKRHHIGNVARTRMAIRRQKH